MQYRENRVCSSLYLCIGVVAFTLSGALLKADDRAEANDRRLYPGEEIITPAGKKMRVWTTEGPVAVSPAPKIPQAEPDPLPHGLGSIVVDGRHMPAPSQRPDQYPSEGGSYERGR